MKVAFVHGMGLAWGETWPPDVLERTDRTVGGGEAAMLRTAQGLAALGHQVTLYAPHDGESEYKGVRHRPLARKGDCLHDGTEAIVSWNDEQILRASARANPGQRRVFSQQLNHMPTDLEAWKAIDVIISPSKRHAEYLVQSFVPEEAPFRFVFMPSGIDAWRYAGQRPFHERPMRVGHWSSPDRGLHHLLLAWREIKRRIPDARLDVFYHLAKLARMQIHETSWTLGEVIWRSRLLRQLIEEVPDFEMRGALPRSVLAADQIETRVMAYPYDPVSFTESFATAIGEALAAGCRVVAHPADSLQEVWGDAVRWVEAPLCGEDFRHRFAEAVCEALTAPEWPHDAAARALVEKYTWETASRQVEKAIVTNPLPPPFVWSTAAALAATEST